MTSPKQRGDPSDSPILEKLVTADGGVTKQVMVPGIGPRPAVGDTVTVHYMGVLVTLAAEHSRRPFADSRAGAGRPLSFVLGARHVVVGLDAAVQSMRLGENALVSVASTPYGYGAAGKPPNIPPNADMLFEVELLACNGVSADRAASQMRIQAIKTAARSGGFRIDEHAVEVAASAALSTDTLLLAASGGSLAAVQWMDAYERAYPEQHVFRSRFTPNVMDRAAAAGHLHVVRWLHEHRSDGCTDDAMDEAAAGGHLAVVQWLHEHRHEGCTCDAMDEAARYGHVAVLQWLHCHRTEGFTDYAVLQAAQNGHLAALRYLSQISGSGQSGDSPPNSVDGYNRTATGAVGSTSQQMDGQLPGLSTPQVWHRAMARAAAAGQLEVVQWLHRHRCQDGCSTTAMDSAAACGNLRMLQWLHANRRPGLDAGCSECAVERAFLGGHEETVSWLYANDLEGGSVDETGRKQDHGRVNEELPADASVDSTGCDETTGGADASATMPHKCNLKAATHTLDAAAFLASLPSVPTGHIAF